MEENSISRGIVGRRYSKPPSLFGNGLEGLVNLILEHPRKSLEWHGGNYKERQRLYSLALRLYETKSTLKLVARDNLGENLSNPGSVGRVCLGNEIDIQFGFLNWTDDH
jgi:hypothetical protein